SSGLPHLDRAPTTPVTDNIRSAAVGRARLARGMLKEPLHPTRHGGGHERHPEPRFRDHTHVIVVAAASGLREARRGPACPSARSCRPPAWATCCGRAPREASPSVARATPRVRGGRRRDASHTGKRCTRRPRWSPLTTPLERKALER